MFLFVHGIRPEPVVIPTLAWSHGCSSGGGRYGSRPVRKAVNETEKKADEWTEAQVGEWLEKKGFGGEVAKAFATNKIDGRALLGLTSDDVKEMVPTIGVRRRLESFIREVAVVVDEARVENSDGQDQDNMQDLSCTVYLGALTQLAFVGPLLSQRKLPRVSLVTYTAGGGRRNRWGNDEPEDDAPIPPGTPYAMVDMRDVTVSSWSTGGSGGEDRLTGNCTLSGERSTHTSFGIRDHKGVSWEVHARALGVDPRDPTFDPEFTKLDQLERCMGVSVIYDGKKTALVEWGGHVRWSKATHSVYPVAFRQAVRTLILCTKRPQECDLARLPKDVLLMIIQRLSHSYNASPFSDYPFPDPKSLEPEKPKEGEAEEI